MKWSNSAYGLDFQNGTPVVVRAALCRGKLTFDSCPPEEIKRHAARSSQRTIAAAMPLRRSITQLIAAPYVSRKKAMKVFPTILDIQLPFALEECVYQILRVSRSDEEGGFQALAVVARKTDVSEAIGALDARGFDVTVLDHEGLALWEHSLREAPVTSVETGTQRIVIYIGLDRMTVVIGKGVDYQMAHGVSMNNHTHIHRLVRSAIGDGRSSVRWYWAGPGVENEQSFRELEKSLLSSWPGQSICHNDPATFLARGLASRLLMPGTTHCNMRAGTLIHPAADHSARRQLTYAAQLILVAGIVLGASGIAVMSWASGRQNVLTRQFVEKAEDILGHSLGPAKGRAALLMINRSTEKQRSELEPFLRNFLPSRTVLMSELVNAGKESEMHFNVLSVQPDQVIVEGVVESTNGIDAIAEVLKRHGYMAILESGLDEWGGRGAFTVTAKVANE